MSVRLILDGTALQAYFAGDKSSVELGELLAEVEENGDTTGIPALTLIETYPQLKTEHQRWLFELVADDDGPAVVMPTLAADVATVAELRRHFPIDRAQIIADVRKYQATLATFDRGAYGSALDPDDILDLERSPH